MQMQSTYWLHKVLKTISLYVNALLCTLQHIVIHAMKLSGDTAVLVYETAGRFIRAPLCITMHGAKKHKIGELYIEKVTDPEDH
jgi:hypothetical protein